MSLAAALPAALAYGIADFAGGLAARRAPVLTVTAVVQVIGLVTLAPAALLVPGGPSVAAAGLGALAGLAGAAGLLLYLRGLAVGPMGVVAPLSAVVGAGLPLLIGMLTGERPGPVALLALGVALVAIVLAGAGTSWGTGGRTGVLLGLASGLGFGLFFVALDATPADSGLWPLLAGRLTTAPLLAGAVLLGSGRGLALRRRVAALSGVGQVARGEGPAAGNARTVFPRRRSQVGLMIVSGVFDTLANVLFLLATRQGALGVSAVVVSLYPVIVVLLARAVLRERLTRVQLTSAGLALGASVLLAVG